MLSAIMGIEYHLVVVPKDIVPSRGVTLGGICDIFICPYSKVGFLDEPRWEEDVLMVVDNVITFMAIHIETS